MNAGAREPSGARATDTLLKMLALERRRRYDDRAVSGGLDGFLRRALGGGTPPPAMLTAVAALPQRGYGSLSPGERARWATQAAGLLRGGQSSRPPRARGGPGGPAAHRPAAHRPAPHQRRARTAPPTIEAGRHPLETPVAALGRVGGGTIQTLKRVGVESVGDLLWYFPARHSDFTNVKAIAALVVGEQATVVGQVRSARVAPIGRRRSSEAVIEDESGRIRALWFNQPYLAKSLAEGATVGLAGKVSAYRGRLQFDSPEWEILAGPGESVEAEEASTHVGRLVPVYPLTQGLPQRRVRQLARAALDRYLTYVPEALPPEVLDETRYLPAQDAIRELHFPASAELREAARERLAFEELLAIQLAVVRRTRDAKARQDAPVITLDGAFLQRFIEALPFQLTGAQMRALTEIRTDLGQPEPMARLLQGDVGSGKTVIAAAAMLGAVAAGRQAVLMAPTEVLAEQHYRTLSGLFGEGPAGSPFHDYSVSPALGRPVRMALLTGSTALARKRALQDALHGGDLEIAVGTHALIQERVGFDRLGVAVVDEQHRFGVLQRDALRGKGGSPHLLVMTATPIPRTLALTVYGDLDVSRLDELPPGRLPVETHYIEADERQRVYAHVRAEIAAGRQAFVICPLVEESDAVSARAAVQEFERLRSGVFPDLAGRMRLLHGRMSALEKERVMGEFRQNEAAILVSTAVVEVGVDVPNASLIVIEGAERFGLSQLHQFRGRVGRSAHQSYCYLLSDSESESADDRLRLLESSNDGFALAEADLRMRGPGEYFGTRQTGLPDLRVAKLTDQALLLKARNFAERLLERDPHLRAPEHQTLARRARRLSVEGANAVH